MYCAKCGSELVPDAAFCSQCGAEVRRDSSAPTRKIEDAPVGEEASTHPRMPITGTRIAAMVLVVLALCTVFLPWFSFADPISSGSQVAALISTFAQSGLVPPSAANVALWQFPWLITGLNDWESMVWAAQGMSFADSGLGLYYLLVFGLPVLIAVICLVLAIVGIALTCTRRGGKSWLIGASFLLFIGSLVYLAFYLLWASMAVSPGAAACCLISLVALVVSCMNEHVSRKDEGR